MEKESFLIKKQTFIKKNESRVEEVYRISKKPLGTGAYGVVSKCTHLTTKQERAVKKVPKKKIKNMERFK
jgi:calcium-dependent protein kinase